ncbi:MAG: hypothetical protein ACE5ER_10425 [Nitrospinaceae bacterium]
MTQPPDTQQKNPPATESGPPESPSFWKKHKGELGLALLFLYLILLGLGTIGELFDIEWILDLPLFRSPGKY